MFFSENIIILWKKTQIAILLKLHNSSERFSREFLELTLSEEYSKIKELKSDIVQMLCFKSNKNCSKSNNWSNKNYSKNNNFSRKQLSSNYNYYYNYNNKTAVFGVV